MVAIKNKIAAELAGNNRQEIIVKNFKATSIKNLVLRWLLIEWTSQQLLFRGVHSKAHYFSYHIIKTRMRSCSTLVFSDALVRIQQRQALLADEFSSHIAFFQVLSEQLSEMTTDTFDFKTELRVAQTTIVSQ